MLFLPFEQFTIKTYLNPQEVRNRLEDVIEARQRFRRLLFSRNHLPYEGVVGDNSFKATRIIHYRNSFLPVISGEIREGLGDTMIEITMKPNALAIIFTVIWLGIFLAFWINVGGFVLFSLGNTSSVKTLAFGAGVTVLIYLFVNGSFQFEAIKSRKFFQTLLEARL